MANETRDFQVGGLVLACYISPWGDAVAPFLSPFLVPFLCAMNTVNGFGIFH